MSTDKTSLSHIPLLAGLLSLCVACAPMSPGGDHTAANTRLLAPLTQAESTLPATDESHLSTETSSLDDETTVPEPEQTASEEIKNLAGLDNNWEEGAAADEEEIRYDFPVTVNRQVEFYLNFFQTSQRATFAKWLSRSGRYLPLFQQKLQEAGLPLDLAYLPMIESGYNLTAYSSAGAAGPWQFMRSTGRHYGLKINRYVDERRDPIKSTDAAIKYLSKLYNDFGSWQLAVAAYNAGEGRVKRAIRRKGTDNFWKIAQGRALNIETKRYVPKLIAAIMIAKNPGQYGFNDIVPEPPLAFEEIHTPPWTTLAAVAVAGSIDKEELRNLNRQLRRAMTPPGTKNYTLKVPTGKAELIRDNLPRVHASIATEFRTHIVSRTDSLSKIGRRYNLNKTTLLKANNLHGPTLKVGQRLQIPFQTTTYSLLKEDEVAGRQGAVAINAKNLLLHKVKGGETLSHLSTLYNVPAHLIASWNGLKSINNIRAGQQLALYLDENSRKLAEQTPLKTAKRGTSQPATQRDAKNRQQLSYYKVRGGDSLWTIAKKFD
ncbi:MAG: transglycosylase SLT domain-containing protein, partial [Desulfobulbaceae bacterium]|nr:transglycosylase SLT domain-containing protein [Desulfobulbaceae bacterium]